MRTLSKPVSELTAADLMSRQVTTIPVMMSLRAAARRLTDAGVRGAPVVDADGRCVGVLSVSDLARWAVNRDAPASPRPRACSYQDRIRELDGDVVLCTLPAGACHIQRSHRPADGPEVPACGEPHCIPVDWQVVEAESPPEEDVRHYMTTGAVTARGDTTVTDLARLMAGHGIDRLIVLDERERVTGVVSSSDLIAALAAAGEGPGGPA